VEKDQRRSVENAVDSSLETSAHLLEKESPR
jgi:hypothetical protein